jgi:hypothetical protein
MAFIVITGAVENSVAVTDYHSPGNTPGLVHESR